MFLVFGTNDCRYCELAKTLLKERNASFTYVSLDNLFGKNWRDIFDKLKHVKKLTNIPIIFKSLKDEDSLSIRAFLLSCETFGLKDSHSLNQPDIDFETITDDWSLVGSYSNLIDMFEKLDDLVDREEILKLDLDY